MPKPAFEHRGWSTPSVRAAICFSLDTGAFAVAIATVKVPKIVQYVLLHNELRDKVVNSLRGETSRFAAQLLGLAQVGDDAEEPMAFAESAWSLHSALKSGDPIQPITRSRWLGEPLKSRRNIADAGAAWVLASWIYEVSIETGCPYAGAIVRTGAK